MKKLLVIIFVVLLVPVVSYSITWHTANQKTVGWDAVTTIMSPDGEIPIPDTDTVEYVVYIANIYADVQKLSPIQVWRGTDTSIVITLPTEGGWVPGVKSVRILPDGTEVNESSISWADNPDVCADGNTFGIRMFYLIANPKGMNSN